MTPAQRNAIKALADAKGWQAVRDHLVYGAIWRKALAEQRQLEDSIDKDIR